MLQIRSRTRPCNVAQNGGSTSVCTSTGIERESCNTNQCREFQPIFYPDWIKFSLQVTFSQRLETARPYLALRRDLPAFSPSTSWESPTPAAPQSMETPHLGAPPRLMLTTTMSVVTGDTVMPPALSKVQKWYNSICEWVILAFHTQRLLSLLPREPVRLCDFNPWMQFQKKIFSSIKN